MADPAPRPTAAFNFDVDGVSLTMSVFVDDVPKILTWTDEEVILYLGQEGPLLQAGLRQIFGS